MGLLHIMFDASALINLSQQMSVLTEMKQSKYFTAPIGWRFPKTTGLQACPQRGGGREYQQLSSKKTCEPQKGGSLCKSNFPRLLQN